MTWTFPGFSLVTSYAKVIAYYAGVYELDIPKGTAVSYGSTHPRARKQVIAAS